MTARLTLLPPNPSGYCRCGCGLQTARARQSDSKRGYVRGEHVPFVPGHRSLAPRSERFWTKVDKGTTCWTWDAAADQHGYGRVSVGEGVVRLAHRVAFELTSGEPIPDGMNVCHHCDNPRCVRPDHLFLGTQRDNIHDMFRKHRQGVGKLSADQVEQVRDLCAAGWRRRDIAAAFGVDRSSVENINSGRTHGLQARTN